MAHILTEESSLTRRRRSLEKETGALQTLLRWEAGLAALLTVAGVAVFFVRGDATLFWLGIAAGVFFLAHYIRIRQNSREERIVQAGLKGETEVTRRLAEALDNSHYIFNDLLIKQGRQSAQIDHLVVSPKGIFAIETKNWRGRIEGREDEDRWSQFKQPDKPPIRVSNPIKQTRRHVDILRGALERAGIDWPGIVSIVVFMSPNTEFSVQDSKTPVLRPKEAVDYIANYQAEREYSEDEVTAILNLLMRNKR